MTGGVGGTSRPPLPPLRKGAEYFIQFYQCPCDARPFVRNGHVSVEHRQWCPIMLLKNALLKR